MIEGFTGMLGGGKSYSAVRRMSKYIMNGGLVCTNIDLKWKEIVKYCKGYGIVPDRKQYIKLTKEMVDYTDEISGKTFQVPQLALFHRYCPPGTPEKPTLVVIEEAAIYLDCRNWKLTPDEMLTFLLQSRHQCTDIIFIAQVWGHVDKKVRQLAQYVWSFRDMRKVPGPFKIKIRVPLVQATCHDYTGKLVISRSFYRIKSPYRDMYKTHELYKEFPRLERVEIKQGREAKIVDKRVVMGICLLMVGVFSVIVMKMRSGFKEELQLREDQIKMLVEGQQDVPHPDDVRDESEQVVQKRVGEEPYAIVNDYGKKQVELHFWNRIEYVDVMTKQVAMVVPRF